MFAVPRFLKAKLAACQTQLEETLRANQDLEQDLATLRKQVRLLGTATTKSPFHPPSFVSSFGPFGSTCGRVSGLP